MARIRLKRSPNRTAATTGWAPETKLWKTGYLLNNRKISEGQAHARLQQVGYTPEAASGMVKRIKKMPRRTDWEAWGIKTMRHKRSR